MSARQFSLCDDFTSRNLHMTWHADLTNSYNLHLKYFSISITLKIIQKLCIYLCSVIGARFITLATKLKITSQWPRCMCIYRSNAGVEFCVCVPVVLCMQGTCSDHVSKRQKIELSWKMLKQRAGWADQWLLAAFAKLRKATIGFVMSAGYVRPHGTTRLPLDRFSWNLIFEDFFYNMPRKFKFDWNLTSMTGTLREDLRTFMTISRSVLLRMRNVSDKSCRENQNTHFVFSNFFFPKIVPFMR
jgi:hypothetical protein